MEMITVKGPDGLVVHIPTGTPPEQIDQIMQKAYLMHQQQISHITSMSYSPEEIQAAKAELARRQAMQQQSPMKTHFWSELHGTEYMVATGLLMVAIFCLVLKLLKKKISLFNGWQRLIFSFSILWFIFSSIVSLFTNLNAGVGNLLSYFIWLLILNAPSVLISSLLIWSIEGFKAKRA
jgi:hypothetical protein